MVLQVSLEANLPAAAATASPALAALLRAAPRAQLEDCSQPARQLLHCFLHPFAIVVSVQQAPSARLLINAFWQRVMEHPLALAATVDPLQACPGAEAAQRKDMLIIALALEAHVLCLDPNKADGWHFNLGWTDWLAAGSLQRYALKALADESLWSTLDTEQAGAYQDHLMQFLASAALAGKMSESRLSSLLTHQEILAPLREVGEGRGDADSFYTSAVILGTALQSSGKKSPPSAGSSAQRAVLSAMLEAMRQGAALLQVEAIAPAKQQRAVRTALKKGFLKVHFDPQAREQW